MLPPRDALRALLRSLFDYAGLFPPAARTVDAAAGAYGLARRGPHDWMLGSFVVSLTELDALVAARERVAGSTAWPVSVLVGEAGEEQAVRLRQERDRCAGKLVLGAVEVAPLRAEEIPGAAARLPADVQTFFESPIDDALEARLDAIAVAGACAKVRMGGVVPAAFPDVDRVARFVAGCKRRGLPFKATAGLHHPLRGAQPVTYEDDSPSVVMHGFLNLAVASALLDAGALEPSRVAAVLAEEEASAFRANGRELAWRELHADLPQIERCRRSFFCSVGSCSFDEPVADLRALGLLDVAEPVLAAGVPGESGVAG
ncbi:MAG TPA: hypothetical protein VMV46_22435 [Thermoanaerobaculia bacterium]|nr:hypothetical protein [Thermoanaerobaculia bacterium]